MSAEACPECGHPLAMGMCWRLTCRTNGARESADLVQSPEYQRAKHASAAMGSAVQRDPFQGGLLAMLDAEEKHG